ncbi:PREDICTED: zinc finger CCCH domain-containing protein 18-like isoform X4 [Priapulus caudatus]|uniref:Zinc finger CCCH domain-containing protein 18-like isoform X3 n=1 Tax=Priapulus caudatus TaxID=37621 RepID=A0ABM1EQM2_PRICU|nr:PREDICTED: zinc finger CCCH domain-containing protein 18-like isoform X3 [Priapulus caudatus]XP_014674494.1 PREDICTED: zinc finger CCCH domain-containing protein 18-like isoform X4 [Priapulus caudatus]
MEVDNDDQASSAGSDRSDVESMSGVSEGGSPVGPPVAFNASEEHSQAQRVDSPAPMSDTENEEGVDDEDEDEVDDGDEDRVKGGSPAPRSPDELSENEGDGEARSDVASSDSESSQHSTPEDSPSHDNNVTSFAEAVADENTDEQYGAEVDSTGIKSPNVSPKVGDEPDDSASNEGEDLLISGNSSHPVQIPQLLMDEEKRSLQLGSISEVSSSESGDSEEEGEIESEHTKATEVRIDGNAKFDGVSNENTKDTSESSDGELDEVHTRQLTVLPRKDNVKQRFHSKCDDVELQGISSGDRAVTKIDSQVNVKPDRSKIEVKDVSKLQGKIDEAEEISDEGLVSDSDEGLLSESSDEKEKCMKHTAHYKRNDSLEDDLEQLDYGEGEEEGEIQERRPSREKKKHLKADLEEGEVEEGEYIDSDLDEGEIVDGEDDGEEGELKEFHEPASVRPRNICRFFSRGQCTWGANCRFTHVNPNGSYNVPGRPTHAPPLLANPPHVMRAPPPERRPPPPLPPPPPEELAPAPRPSPPRESAWERGLRKAKEALRNANMKKETEPDYEEKCLNLSVEVVEEFEQNKENRQLPEKKVAPPFQDGFEEELYPPLPPQQEYENFEVRRAGHERTIVHEMERSRPRREVKERVPSPPVDKFGRHRDLRQAPRKAHDSSEKQPRPSSKKPDEWHDPWNRARRSQSPSKKQTRSPLHRRRSVSSNSYSSSSSGSSSYSSSSRSSSGSSHSGSSYSRSSSRSLSPRARRVAPDAAERRAPAPDGVDRRAPGPGGAERRPQGTDGMDRRHAGPDASDRRQAGPDGGDRRQGGPDGGDRRQGGPDMPDRRAPGPDRMDRRGPAQDRMDRRGPGLDRRGPGLDRMDRQGPVSDRMDRRGPQSDIGDRRGPPMDRMDRRGPQQNRVDRRGQAPDMVDRRGQAPDMVDRRGQAPDMVDRRGQAPDMVDRRGQGPDMVDRRGPAQERMDRRGTGQDMADRRGPAHDRMDRRGGGPDMVDRRGQALDIADRRGPMARRSPILGAAKQHSKPPTVDSGARRTANAENTKSMFADAKRQQGKPSRVPGRRASLERGTRGPQLESRSRQDRGRERPSLSIKDGGNLEAGSGGYPDNRRRVQQQHPTSPSSLKDHGDRRVPSSMLSAPASAVVRPDPEAARDPQGEREVPRNYRDERGRTRHEPASLKDIEGAAVASAAARQAVVAADQAAVAAAAALLAHASSSPAPTLRMRERGQMKV